MKTLTPTGLQEAFLARIDELAPPDLDAALFAQACAKIREHMLPTVAGWRIERPHVIGASKIGGCPDLPHDLPWPTDRSGAASLSFLMQINLAELVDAGLDAAHGLPSVGMFYLFALCDADAAQGYIMDAAYTAVRFVAERASLAPRPLPTDIPARGRVDETALQFGPSLLFEQRFEPTPDPDLDPDDEEYALTQRFRYGSQRFDARVERRIRELLQQLGSHAPEITLVKEPWFFQDEAELQYEPQAQIELLSFFGRDVSVQYHGSVFHVVIDQAALRRGELQRAFVIFERGT